MSMLWHTATEKKRTYVTQSWQKERERENENEMNDFDRIGRRCEHYCSFVASWLQILPCIVSSSLLGIAIAERGYISSLPSATRKDAFRNFYRISTEFEITVSTVNYLITVCASFASRPKRYWPALVFLAKTDQLAQIVSYTRTKVMCTVYISDNKLYSNTKIWEKNKKRYWHTRDLFFYNFMTCSGTEYEILLMVSDNELYIKIVQIISKFLWEFFNDF